MLSHKTKPCVWIIKRLHTKTPHSAGVVGLGRQSLTRTRMRQTRRTKLAKTDTAFALLPGFPRVMSELIIASYKSHHFVSFVNINGPRNNKPWINPTLQYSTWVPALIPVGCFRCICAPGPGSKIRKGFRLLGRAGKGKGMFFFLVPAQRHNPVVRVCVFAKWEEMYGRVEKYSEFDRMRCFIKTAPQRICGA